MTQTRLKMENDFFCLFEGLHQIHLTMAGDSNLNMNPRMSLNGAITLVHVAAVLQLQKAYSPHQNTQTTTLTMQTAPTSSHSPMEHMSTYRFLPWI